jgi:hypothetical protein
MNLSIAFRKSSSVVPGLQAAFGNNLRASTLNSNGQSGSPGSGQSNPRSIALLDASGRRAHHR